MTRGHFSSPTCAMLTDVLFQLALFSFVLFESGWAKNFPPGHLEPLGNSGPVHPVDQVDGFLPPKVFIEQHLKKNRPLLMKEAAKTSPAFNLWTDAYLRSKTPEGKAGNIFVEHGKKENRSDPSGDMNFADFLDRYNESDIYMVNHVPNFLKQDIIMPYSIQCESFNKSFADAVMWFSSGGTKSVLHNDNYENINCLYRGRKRLVFINATKYDSLTRKILDNTRYGHSSVDVEKVDLEKYPFFAGMHFHIVEMDPGDCLYIPYQWYHHVASFDSNLAVNVWFFSTQKIDLKTCRDDYDKSLILAKFDYSMKDEGEEAEEEMKKREGKKPVKKEQGKTGGKVSPETIDAVYSNIISFVLPEEGATLSKKEFIRTMTEGKKIPAQSQKILNLIFLILDSNKNGKLDEVDADARINDKLGNTLVNMVSKWQKNAKKLELKTPNFLLEASPGEKGKPDNDQMESPVLEKAVRTSVEEHEEL